MRVNDMLLRSFRSGSGQRNAILVATVGLGLLIAESAMLSLRGDGRLAVCLLAVLLASTGSSIAGFVFSALCGALLFHVIENACAVQIMLVCSIAIQLFSVTALWRSIEWRCLPVFLIGGVLGVPTGVYLLLNLGAQTFRDVIRCLLIAYGGYLLVRWPTRSLGAGPLADTCAGFSRWPHRRARSLSWGVRHHLVWPEGLG